MDQDVNPPIHALGDQAARFAFLLDLGDAIRRLSDPQQVKSVASRLLGERLEVSRVGYGEIGPGGAISVERTLIDDHARAAPLSHLDDYDPTLFAALRTGGALVVEDVRRSAPPDRLAVFDAAGCGAYVAVPILKDGLLVGAMSLIQAAPRRWTTGEIALLEETAERTWEAIERARAEGRLRASERRLCRVLDHVPVGVGLFDREGRFTLANDRARAFVVDVIPSREPAADQRWLSEPVEGRRLTPDAFPGARALRGEDTAEGVRFQHLKSDGSRRWVRVAATSTRDDLGQLDGGVMIFQDVDRDVSAERRLAESEARLRSLIEGLPQLIWRADRAGRWVWLSPQWQIQTGQSDRDAAGDGWIEAVHPDDRDATRAAWRDALASGALHVEHRLRDVRSGGWRWHQTRAAAIRDEREEVSEWSGACTDIHALRSLQERQRVLLSELQHRTRNLMAVVRAIGAASAEHDASTADYQRRFNRRLGALERAQTLLSNRLDGGPVTLDALLRSELTAVVEAGDQWRVELEGPADVAIRSREVQIVTLALHELFDNALEHGALSQPGGKVSVRWHRTPRSPPRVRLDWKETGAVPPRPPVSSGFGREIIENALPYQAGADVDYAFTPAGVTCAIELDLRSI